MEDNKIFVPHELKTIEVDVEKKIFRVNGEDFGKHCTGFSISGAVGDFNQWFDITMNVSNDIVFGSKYNMRGERTYDKVPRKQE